MTGLHTNDVSAPPRRWGFTEAQGDQRADAVFRFNVGPLPACEHASQIEATVLQIEEFQPEENMLICFVGSWRVSELLSAPDRDSTRVPLVV